jgi:hypothetical protein
VITKSMLDWTIEQRARPRSEMHLTPGGALEAEVNEMERERIEESIRLQATVLERARTALRADQAERFSQGLCKAQFNVTQEIKL